MRFLFSSPSEPSRSRPARKASRRRSPFHPRIENLEERQLLTTFFVTNANNDGSGSLRWAMAQANSNPGLDTITFNIGGGGLRTIRPTSSLPTITSPVLIDGTTQPGFAGTPLIELTKNDAGFFSDGLRITAGNSTVRGLVINGYPGAGIVLAGNGGNLVQGNYIGTDATGSRAMVNTTGVLIEGGSNNTVGGTIPAARNLLSGNGTGVRITSGASGNQIQGNYIGTNVTGDTALQNGRGVVLDGLASNNAIGGAVPGARNLISGNRDDGVALLARNNFVQGNYIGTNAAGTAALRNRQYGVYIEAGNNTIGGAAAGAGNLISGNNFEGIWVENVSGIMIQGNKIGTDAAGVNAVPNNRGVTIIGADNVVGGSIAGSGNVISGNLGSGIWLFMSARNTLIQGNYVGTNITGTAALPNHTGVSIGTSGNTIGGTAPGAFNVISGNQEVGLSLGSSDNVVQGNHIGTDVTGTAAVPNGTGVSMGAGGNTIGGTTAAARNVISGNRDDGIRLQGSGNRVQGNYIGTNAAGTAALPNTEGVRLAGGSAHVVGGTAAGAGNLISGNTNYGVRVASGMGHQIQGNTIGTDATGATALGNVGGVLIEGGSDNTVGSTLSGGRNVISGNRGTGVQISGSNANFIQGNYIGTDATGTRGLGNNEGVAISGSNNIVGGTVSGAGNVISGNRASGVLVGGAGNRVQGNSIGTNAAGTAALGNGSGVDIVFSASNTQIGGTVAGAGNLISGNDWAITVGASGNQIQGNVIGMDLNGTKPLANNYGVNIVGSNNTVGGATPEARNLISGNTNFGVRILGGRDNEILGNYVGTDATGSASVANGIGVYLSGEANYNTIGGTTSGSSNLISGNTGDGVLLEPFFASDRLTGNRVLGNYIGTDVTGLAALPNSIGVRISGGASDNTIGSAGAGNLIAGNNGDAVRIQGEAALGNQLQGNFIGLAADGVSPLGNGGHGVALLEGAAGNLIGGMEDGAGNYITYNGGTGVFVDASPGNAFRRNALFGNIEAGILLQGFSYPEAPVVTSALWLEDGAVIEGTLAGPPDTVFELEFFANTTCHASGFGEGESYLDTLAVMTDEFGIGSFSLLLWAAVGEFITATGTGPAGTTSAFSACVEVTGPGMPGAGGGRLGWPAWGSAPGMETISVLENGDHRSAGASLLPLEVESPGASRNPVPIRVAPAQVDRFFANATIDRLAAPRGHRIGFAEVLSETRFCGEDCLLQMFELA